MASIRGLDTRPELLVRSFLHRAGLRFRLGGCRLPGRPDLVFPRFRTVVFVHGCFWHRHKGCPNCTQPATRAEFWKAKFDQNVQRDLRSTALLVELGWQVITVWECESNSQEFLDQVFWKILSGPAHGR